MTSRIDFRDRTDIASLLLLLVLGMGFVSGLSSFMFGVSGTFLPVQEEFIRITSSAISTFNPELMILIQVYQMMLGLLFTTLTVAGVFVFKYGLRKKEMGLVRVFNLGSFVFLAALAVILPRSCDYFLNIAFDIFWPSSSPDDSPYPCPGYYLS